MNDSNLKRIIEDEYSISIISDEVLSTGLINATWKLVCLSNQCYVLQEINSDVFTDPNIIDRNISKLKCYLNDKDSIANQQLQHDTTTPTTTTSSPSSSSSSTTTTSSSTTNANNIIIYPLKTKNNNTILIYNNKYYRLYDYINSTTITIITNKDIAYEASHIFSKFTNLFNNYNTNELEITINDFHNLPLRYQQFEIAINNCNNNRINIASNEINILKELKYLCDKYSNFIKHAKLRVHHHDTKISNVLFDNNNKAIYVIDLDTVMGGYFISDLGDMIRTYICPVDENESDFNQIHIREDYLQAVIDGYLSSVSLTEFEKEHLYFSGEVMIYMQALRFLTDYINDDKYYKISYDNHNYVRACNQLCLLQHLQKYISDNNISSST